MKERKRAKTERAQGHPGRRCCPRSMGDTGPQQPCHSFQVLTDGRALWWLGCSLHERGLAQEKAEPVSLEKDSIQPARNPLPPRVDGGEGGHWQCPGRSRQPEQLFCPRRRAGWRRQPAAGRKGPGRLVPCGYASLLSEAWKMT